MIFKSEAFRKTDLMDDFSMLRGLGLIFLHIR